MNDAPTPSVPLEPREIARMLWRRKWLLALPWATAVVIGVVAAFVLPPVYFSSTILVLDRGQSMAGPFGSSLQGGPDVEQQADIMREQVQSSLFLKSVIGATGVLQDPATRAWALRSARGHYPGLKPDEQVEAFLVDYLRDAINVKRSKGQLFEVVVGDVDPDRARRFADAVANQFVASSKAHQLEAVQAQQEFSVEQMQIYKRDLDEAEAKLDAAKRAGLQATLTGGTVNDRNYAFAQTLLEQAGTDMEDQRQRVADLRSALAGRVRDTDLAQLTSPDVTDLMAQMQALDTQLGRAMLMEGSTSAGTNVRLSLANKSAELETALGRNAARALPAAGQDTRDLAVRYRIAESELASREAWHAWLNGQVGVYQRQIVAAPDQQLDLQRLQADVDQKRAIYTTFQTQSAGAQIAEAFQNAKVSGRFIVMEPATRPLSPGKPNRPLLVALAFLLGGALGTGTVLLVEHHDQSVKNADEVESLLGLPVLGAVPRVEELERSRHRPRPAAAAPGALPPPRDPGLLQRLKVESPLGLEFKRIYLNLAHSRQRTLPHTLMITSATRGEGKTTTSACLGITLAREHRARTLLVDFDLRSPSLHRALGMPGSSWGLAQMLQSQEFDERFVRQTSLANLDFLAAGRSERPAAELVEQSAVAWFVGAAAARYELVVLDAAPNLAVPDPLILGRVVDGVLYVIKAGATTRKAAEYGVKVQRGARDNLLGVLMNDAGDFLPQYYGYKSQYYGYTTEAAEG